MDPALNRVRLPWGRDGAQILLPLDATADLTRLTRSRGALGGRRSSLAGASRTNPAAAAAPYCRTATCVPRRRMLVPSRFLPSVDLKVSDCCRRHTSEVLVGDNGPSISSYTF
eukprot:Polyplicarium_translucidae@DN2650_c0_g1_i1.p2